MQVIGEKDTLMHKHLSTKEAIISVEKGNTIIEINATEQLLKKKDSLVIPAGVPHSLIIKSNFKALVIMPIESEIKFIN